MEDISNRLIVALDVPTIDEALRVVDELAGTVGWFKIGSQLYTAAGPEVVRLVTGYGLKVFLDLKFHDIPATVSLAGRAATQLGVNMFNVHSSGGGAMMRAAVEGARATAAEGRSPCPMIIAVTILTSMDQNDLRQAGCVDPVGRAVMNLAKMARECGLDGVVSSAEETGDIKKNLGRDFLVVTPGVRPAWAAADDQKRVKTPSEAIRDGADYLVIGRPILKAKDPVDAARRVLDEMGSAL